ncbi:MAG TPA: YebC/PmpR family DNA-binding transcriptional regulator [bacterium]|nr:YebC/PmpR family DNA-binding transcriptional regulator [bacterium]HQL62548.1 YebC/PmpR family DNA-binding transcriptional regulator [bacterium]
MSGHSKWSTIKHKKAKMDAQRGKIFTKLIKEITVAARSGGGDLDGNPRLRTAVAAARAANMPAANVEKAIKKGTGELEGVTYEEVTYEGYGPGGVAIYVECVTDNRNRTTAEIRHLFSKYGGNLGASGCVSHMFHRRGLISLSKSAIKNEDAFMEAILEAGAEDVKEEGDTMEVITSVADFESVKEAVAALGITPEVAELTRIPSNTVKLEGKAAETMLKLMEFIEDHDDVQNVYANFDIPDEVMAAAQA